MGLERTRTGEMTAGGGRRLRIARGLNEAALRSVLATEHASTEGRLDLVLAPGRRFRIARGLDLLALRSVVAAVELGGEARIELVIAGDCCRP